MHCEGFWKIILCKIMNLHGNPANVLLSGQSNMMKLKVKTYQVLCLSCIIVLDIIDAKVFKPQLT